MKTESVAVAVAVAGKQIESTGLLLPGDGYGDGDLSDIPSRYDTSEGYFLLVLAHLVAFTKIRFTFSSKNVGRVSCPGLK